MAARALAFLILTAVRSGEVRGMTWAEIDARETVWTVPAGRMKTAREHRVLLTEAALALLGERGAADALVFPSPSDPEEAVVGHDADGGAQADGPGGSDRARLPLDLPRLGRGDAGDPREVIEAALAHRLKDKAEAAYARGDLFTKRRRLMEDWAAISRRRDAYPLDIGGDRRVGWAALMTGAGPRRVDSGRLGGSAGDAGDVGAAAACRVGGAAGTPETSRRGQRTRSTKYCTTPEPVPRRIEALAAAQPGGRTVKPFAATAAKP